MAWGFSFRPYVPVAERRRQARREMEKLRKKGRTIEPIEIEGRTIARSFWGKGWCKHLESFSDYANRLPRGRTYVRNGSVCHLAVKAGRIDAIVSGSELYQLDVRINKLSAEAWERIKKRCAGKVGSMLELLQGKLSNEVMAVVTDREAGLFPTPREIKLDCSCPDWAVMCKHVAAVLYGVGHRLDAQPELLFTLRGVDPQELIASEITLPQGEPAPNALEEDQLSDIFGIDLETPATTAKNGAAAHPKPDDANGKPRRNGARSGQKRTQAKARQPASKRATTKHAKGNRATATRPSQTVSKQSALGHGKATNGKATRGKGANTRATNGDLPRLRPTGRSVARLRRNAGHTVAEFAQTLGVTPATVYRWEATSGRLNLQHASLQALAQLHQRTYNR